MCSYLQMVLKLNMGKPDTARESFLVLNVKSMLLIIPAIFIGHYIDELVQLLNIQDKKRSVAVQTLLNVLVIFVLHKMSTSYTKEFQMTLAGLFFSALFFGMQTNYITNLKSLLPHLA